MTRRVIVTGSRYWSDRAAVRRALEGEYLALESGRLVVVHGGCASGADAYAAEWCRQNNGWDLLTEESHAADWDRYGKAAGPIRNGQMVAKGADLVLAFLQPDAPNNGTRNCIKLARAAGIPVRTYPQESP